MDDIFMNFPKRLAKVLIHNSFINEKTYGSTSDISKRKISHILEIAPTHANDYNKKGFSHKSKDTNNTSVIGQNVKIYKHIAHVS